MSLKTDPTRAPQNGHAPDARDRAAWHAEAEERRRVVKAAYAALPEPLLYHIARLARQKADPAVRCGALELVDDVRRLRARYTRPTA